MQNIGCFYILIVLRVRIKSQKQAVNIYQWCVTDSNSCIKIYKCTIMGKKPYNLHLRIDQKAAMVTNLSVESSNPNVSQHTIYIC